MRRLPSLALLLAIGPLAAIGSGCDVFGHPDQREGELGTYHVTATASENDCGEGALGMASQWEFDVDLFRTSTALQWDNGYDIVEGPLAEDGRTFTFETAFDQDMRTEADPRWIPPCTIRRTDVASGELSSDTDDVQGFTGELGYTFTPTAGSDCSDLVGAQGPVFLKLPCTVRYGVEAERTRAPGEEKKE